ncbi:hypothetical protein AB0J84_29980 [Micromonospora arborensis]
MPEISTLIVGVFALVVLAVAGLYLWRRRGDAAPTCRRATTASADE